MRKFVTEVKRQWKADQVVRIGMKLRALRIDSLLYGTEWAENEEITRLEQRQKALLDYLKRTA